MLKKKIINSLIQIGANDGVTHDHLNHVIKKFRLQSLLLEPIKESFLKLIINYSNFENVGLSYYALSDYSNAVPWFEKVFAIRPKVDGKSEYFLGLSYVNLGDRNKGCPFLKLASDLNFSEGRSYYSSLCK